MKEEWKPIPDYEGYYEVSNTGLVRSLDRWISKKSNKGKSFYVLIKGKMLKPNELRDGYLKVTLRKGGIVKYPTVHSICAKTFIDSNYRKKNLTVNHKDGNKKNNNISNLEIITMKKNIHHAINIGLRDDKGENNPNANLNWKQVNFIRDKKTKYKGTELAKMFNISTTNISRIINNKIWKE